LQADFKILPVGVTDAGAWHYAFAYDVVARHYPQLPDLAHHIRESEARQRLCELYFRSVGAAQLRDVVKLFRWRKLDAGRAVEALAGQGVVRQGLELEGQEGEWIGLEGVF
jgi:hypothetical protein